MKNTTVLNLCISDVNELIGLALRDHVLKDGEYVVSEVSWNERDNLFKITLEPKPAGVAV